MKKKLMFVAPVLLLLVGGFVAKKILMKPPPPPVAKIEGTLVTLAPEFLVNLKDGHYGKVTVAVEMKTAPAPEAGSTSPVLEENAAVRARVTDALTGLDSEQLIERKNRKALQTEILRSIKKETDESVTDVMFTDIAVQ